jgi:hypothetical protein
MGVDLQKGARPDDHFVLWRKPLQMKVWGNPYIYQTITWYDAQGIQYFKVHILGWYTRWYTGNRAKIDGTRTKMFWAGQLGGQSHVLDQDLYVMNTWSKEMSSFRFHGTPLDLYRWDNQAGI